MPESVGGMRKILLHGVLPGFRGRARHRHVTLCSRTKHSAIESGSACDGTVPVPHCFGPEGAECGSGNQVTLGVEVVVDGGVDRKKALRRSGRFEAPRLTFSSSDRPMRVLGSIVLPQSLLVPRRQSKFPESPSVGSRFVGDGKSWCETMCLQEFAHQLQRAGLATPGLDQEIQNLTFAIHGRPRIHRIAADCDEHLVEAPSIIGFQSRPSKPLGMEASKLQRPPPDRLVGNVDPWFRQQLLDVPIAERES